MATTNEFTTLTTAALLDSLCLAVDAARVAAAGNTRWLNAIDAAFDHILQVESIEYRASDHALLYHSESGQTYTANGRCQCQAFKAGQPCKHRAAAKLVANALAVVVVVPEPVAAPVAPRFLSENLSDGAICSVCGTADWAHSVFNPGVCLRCEYPLPGDAPVAPVAPRFSRFASAGKSAQEEIDELFAA